MYVRYVTPGKDNKHERVEVRVAAEDCDRWRATADAEGLTLSDWIRQLCDARTRDPDVTKLVRETQRLRAKTQRQGSR